MLLKKRQKYPAAVVAFMLIEALFTVIAPLEARDAHAAIIINILDTTHITATDDASNAATSTGAPFRSYDSNQWNNAASDAEKTGDIRLRVAVTSSPKPGRYIISHEPLNIDCPAGTAPKLPNTIKVIFSNGGTDARRVQWGNNATAAQTEQAGYPKGREYTVSGVIIGDSSRDNAGFAVTANVKVVGAAKPVPPSESIAKALPLSAVTIDQTNGADNRLTLNRNAHINYILGIDVNRILYNYYDTFGQSTANLPTPGGWDDAATKLKGHGMGHYLSGLAFAYASGAADAQKNDLRARMATMTSVMRELQELTYVKGTFDFRGTGPEYRYREARDRYSTAAEVSAMTNVRFNDVGTCPKNPALFGAGYINCIQPEHLVLIENYAPYNGTWTAYGVWAPYYALHKQLAGLIDIYNVMSESDRPDDRIIGEKALLIAKEMGLWVWNRLNYCTRQGSSRSTPGNRDAMWALYIAGEFGGMNESLARLSIITRNRDRGESGKLQQASSFFDNNGSSGDTGDIPFFGGLAANRDSIRTLHANQHIPQIVGAIWGYKSSGEEKYYNIAENFWDYVIGRYAFTMGGVTGHQENAEKFVGACGQNAAVDFGADKLCETCAAYNMLKLTGDLNEHNPDNAKYMDYYERLFLNQMVGSISCGSNANRVTYGYHIGLNSSRDWGAGNAAHPGNTCCSGTGTENHVKYQQDTYFATADRKTFYVGLYLPTTVRWRANSAIIKQTCQFPSAESTFTVTPNVGGTTNDFEIKFRVPYWAKKGFDIKLNGASLQAAYESSTYVSTGVRKWKPADTVVVAMPFGFGIDYHPGKLRNNWVGSLRYGPLVMAATGVTEWSTLELDSEYSTGADTNIILIPPTDAGAGTAESQVYRITANLTSGSTGNKTFTPHYYVGGTYNNTTPYTTYFYINATDGSPADRTELSAKIALGGQYLDPNQFEADGLAELSATLYCARSTYRERLTKRPRPSRKP